MLEETCLFCESFEVVATSSNIIQIQGGHATHLWPQGPLLEPQNVKKIYLLLTSNLNSFRRWEWGLVKSCMIASLHTKIIDIIQYFITFRFIMILHAFTHIWDLKLAISTLRLIRKNSCLLKKKSNFLTQDDKPCLYQQRVNFVPSERKTRVRPRWLITCSFLSQGFTGDGRRRYETMSEQNNNASSLRDWHK